MRATGKTVASTCRQVIPTNLFHCQTISFFSGSVDIAGARCYGHKATRTGETEWTYIVNKKVLLAGVACALGLLFVLNAASKEPWSIAFGPADLGEVRFESVEPASTANSFLAPTGLLERQLLALNARFSCHAIASAADP